MCFLTSKSLVLFAALLCPCRVPDSVHLGSGRVGEENTSHEKVPLVKTGEGAEAKKNLVYGKASGIVP